MSGRGRGGGRGRGRGFGGGGFGRGTQLPFEKFPEIECLGKARYDLSKKQLLSWGLKLQDFWKTSPYHYESVQAKKAEKKDIERYSDRLQGATNKKQKLENFIFLDADHLPGELVKEGGARFAKNVRWEIDDDAFKKIEEKALGMEKERREMMKAEEEDKEEEDDEEVKDDDDAEGSDDNADDDYGVGEIFDDDEDDFNDDNDNGNDDEGGVY